MADAIVPNQGDLFTVEIDPTWTWVSPVYGIPNGLWASPIGLRLSAQFVDLDDCITESAGVNYADTDIIGRAEAVKTWIGNGNRETTLVFKFHAQSPVYSVTGAAPPPTSAVQSVIQKEVINPAQFLDALRYPVIDSQGVSHGPPPVILSIGSLLQMRSVVTACDIRWCPPFDPTTMLPHHAEVSVTFTGTTLLISNYHFWDPYNGRRFGDQSINGGAIGPSNPYTNLGAGGPGTGQSTSGSTPVF
jgi:hypothetical protein